MESRTPLGPSRDESRGLRSNLAGLLPRLTGASPDCQGILSKWDTPPVL